MSLIRGVISGRVLEALARYRFLTIGQMAGLGVGNERNIRGHLSDLETAKLINMQEFRLGPSAGRLPNIYWLTPKGAQFVSEANGEPVAAPRPRELKPAHNWHRMLTVDTVIAVDRWAAQTGQRLPDILTYMQRRGDAPLTRLDLGTRQGDADAIAKITDTADFRRTYVLEIYCSRYSEGRSSFSLEQLEAYVLSGQTDALDRSLGVFEHEKPKASRVLVICDTAALRDRIVRTLPKRDGMPPLSDRTWQRFMFKAADGLADFGAGWHKTTGELETLPH